MGNITKASQILRATDDGNDLTAEDLMLVQIAVNGNLNLVGEIAFLDLFARHQSGYLAHEIDYRKDQRPNATPGRDEKDSAP